MTDIRRTYGRARVVSQLREPTQTSVQPANLRTHASRQPYDRKNDAQRQEPLRGEMRRSAPCDAQCFPDARACGRRTPSRCSQPLQQKNTYWWKAQPAREVSSSAQPARTDRTRLLLLRRRGFVLRSVGPAASCGSEEAEATPTALRVRPLSYVSVCCPVVPTSLFTLLFMATRCAA